MKYRMIAIDLDGTLLGPDGRVTERTREAVQRVLKAGLLVCFATGRTWTESEMVLDAVAHYDTAVFAGGAMVVDTRQRVMVHRAMMAPELARELSAWLEDAGHCVLALQDCTSAGIDYLVSDAAPLGEETRLWMDRHRVQLRHLPTLRHHDHVHTIRVGVVGEPAAIIELQRRMQERFGPRVHSHALKITASAVYVMEIFDPAVNKWQGVLHVAKRHGVEASQIVAIGDDVNDVPMLRHAGLGVAMGNALPEVKVIAQQVIKRNDQDGLAEFLEELLASHAVEPMA